MAFEPKNFVICSKFPLFRASCNLWLYTTSDSLEDCLAENYFQPRMNTKNQDSPEVGDIIQCIVGSGTLAYLTITAKTEKPYNITVEKTYLENEAEIYEAIYTAANKGEQLYQTGVWYAKMYSDTVVPTGSEYEDRNYADFSQVDSDNNPIIVVYECRNGAWVEIQRITPPTEYNGYLPITSKFWDIEEQTGQQGGEVLWSFNTKRFTPFPRIISYDSIHITGDSTVEIPDDPSSTQIVNKEYVDDAIAAIPTPTVDVTQSIDAEIVGTLTITDNSVVSGFSYTNYLKLPGVFELGSSDTNSFEIGASFTTTSVADSDMKTIITGRQPGSTNNAAGIDIRYADIDDQKIRAVIINGANQTLTGATNLSPNTKYYIKFEYDGTDYKLWLSTDGESYSLEVSAAMSKLATPAELLVGRGSMASPQSVDMADLYIKKNGQIIWQGMDAPGLHQKANIDLSNIPTNIDYVVESQLPTAQNNYTWYRKYKSGWVEQGGVNHTISLNSSGYNNMIDLPITMADTNYSALAILTAQYGGRTIGYVPNSSTTTQVCIGGYASSAGSSAINWQVSGMAQG